MQRKHMENGRNFFFDMEKKCIIFFVPFYKSSCNKKVHVIKFIISFMLKSCNGITCGLHLIISIYSYNYNYNIITIFKDKGYHDKKEAITPYNITVPQLLIRRSLKQLICMLICNRNINVIFL